MEVSVMCICGLSVINFHFKLPVMSVTMLVARFEGFVKIQIVVFWVVMYSVLAFQVIRNVSLKF
jgi:hypothetical protein